MAKRSRKISGRANEFELSEQLDDHLLPTPDDIIRYKEADPDLPKFIQEVARKEQDFRHEMTKKGANLGFREQALQYGLNYFGLTLAFLLGVGGLIYSYYLLKEGKEINGSIFSGLTLLYMASLFIRGPKRFGPPPPPSK